MVSLCAALSELSQLCAVFISLFHLLRLCRCSPESTGLRLLQALTMHDASTRSQSRVHPRIQPSNSLDAARFNRNAPVTALDPTNRMYTKPNATKPHPTHQSPTAITKPTDPANLVVRTASPFGILPVAAFPKYHAPMSVNWPFCVSIAAFLPTLEALERKAPK